MQIEPPEVLYNPEGLPRTLWENFVVVQTVQACNAMLSSHVQAVAVDAGYELVVVHASVDSKDPDTIEDLDELVQGLSDNLHGYTRPPPEVQLRVHVADIDSTWPGGNERRRLLYLTYWRNRIERDAE